MKLIQVYALSNSDKKSIQSLCQKSVAAAGTVPVLPVLFDKKFVKNGAQFAHTARAQHDVLLVRD